MAQAGSFCWNELHSTDVAKAKAFYTAVLGWKYKEMPMPGEAGIYSMTQIDGKDASGLGGMPPGTPPGVPSHWSIYVAVEDVDATVKKALELGAKTLMPAFDIPQVGRMAVIQDPTGATISLWWNKSTHSGSLAEPTKEGAFCLAELMTTNVDRAAGFYTKLFPWKTKAEDTSYTEWQLGGQSIGGLMAIPKEAKGMPPSWMPYFTVADVAKTADLVKKNGGKLLNGPMEIPKVGKFATVQDPQGGVFNLYQATHR